MAFVFGSLPRAGFETGPRYQNGTAALRHCPAVCRVHRTGSASVRLPTASVRSRFLTASGPVTIGAARSAMAGRPLFVTATAPCDDQQREGNSTPFNAPNRATSMNISSNDFRPGTTIEFEGTVYRVQEFLHVKPGKGAAFVRTKLKNLKAGNTIDKTFKAGEMVSQAQLDKAQMQHTYVDGEDYVFMNMETYEEERLSRAVLGERIINYLMEGLEVEVLKHNDDILGVEIPKSMVMTVASTDPGVRGNTVQGGTKPATLETGAVVQVPLFINQGEKIVVNTEENKYVSRFNE